MKAVIFSFSWSWGRIILYNLCLCVCDDIQKENSFQNRPETECLISQPDKYSEWKWRKRVNFRCWMQIPLLLLLPCILQWCTTWTSQISLHFSAWFLSWWYVDVSLNSNTKLCLCMLPSSAQMVCSLPKGFSCCRWIFFWVSVFIIFHRRARVRPWSKNMSIP